MGSAVRAGSGTGGSGSPGPGAGPGGTSGRPWVCCERGKAQLWARLSGDRDG